MVSEVIRRLEPLAHLRRAAAEDVEFHGQHGKNDKVVLWCVSGNRDETVIERANELIIDREHPRRHLSLGYGVHRCVGNRLAEMRLRAIGEEIQESYSRFEVIGGLLYYGSSFANGCTSVTARIPPVYVEICVAGDQRERR